MLGTSTLTGTRRMAAETIRTSVLILAAYARLFRWLRFAQSQRGESSSGWRNLCGRTQGVCSATRAPSGPPNEWVLLPSTGWREDEEWTDNREPTCLPCFGDLAGPKLMR